MKQRKQKKANRSMRPSRETGWKRAVASFQLTEEELVMAKAAGFSPIEMDEVASCRRGKRKTCYDKLPKKATKSQIAKVKEVLRRRYAKRYGDTDPMTTPWGLKLKLKKKAKEEQRAARKEGSSAGGVVKISLKIPAGLQKRIISWCGERELKVTDELQA